MIHKQAAKNTLALIAAAIMGSLGVFLIAQFMTVEIFVYTLGAGAFIYMIYVFYSMEKHRLETIDKLKKL